jgi:putative aldouronate transport system permease protein
LKSTYSEKVFYVCNYIWLSIVGLSIILPVVHIVAKSLSSAHAVASGAVYFWPVDWSNEAYRALIEGTSIKQSFMNSIIITVVGTCLSLWFTLIAAYPLSRAGFIGRRFYTMAVLFTMLFSGGLIPTYLVVKTLGLVNSYGALWLLGLVSVFNMLVVKNFFEGLPKELEEAAKIDGCGEWGIFIRMAIPLSVPVLAAVGLFYGVGFWNSFMNVMIYINKSSMLNLTVLIQQMIQSQSLLTEINNLQSEDQRMLTPESIKSAGIIVMVVPMLVVYPFVQKYFVKGVMIGAIKG